MLRIQMKTEKISQDKKQGIRFKRQNKRNEQKRKKNKSADEILKIIEEILDYNKWAQKK